MSFRFMLQPKWVAWTLVVVIAAVVMAYLSGWQLGRLNDRRATNAAITERSLEPVVDIGDPSLVGLDADQLRYRRVTASGTYLVDDEVLVANQTFGGAPGWWVVTPMRTDGGSVVLVNRGWVPFASLEPTGSFATVAPPSGVVGVSGILQSSQSPVAAPDPQARALPRLDVAAIGARLGQPVVEVWLQLEDQQPPQATDQPIPLVMPPLDDGPHLNYAGQWAIFATLTVVVFGVLVVRTAQRGGGSGTRRRSLATDPALLVQLGVRLAPLVGRERLAEVTGLPVAEVTDRLADLEAGGLATHHATAPSGWTLTPQGWGDLATQLADQLDGAGLRPAVDDIHSRFVDLNTEVLEVCSQWQVRPAADGGLVLNDHSDPAHDAAVVARLAAADDRAGPLCDELAELVTRFGSYRRRLGAARQRVESGDTAWIDQPLVDSYHTVWFELHEHLLATLGIERGGAPAPPADAADSRVG